MRVCLPVDQFQGLASEIAPNFKQAPSLLVVDTNNQQIEEISCTSGVCGTIPTNIDAIIFADGMGRGMFRGLQAKGIRVFQSDALTVADALAQLNAKQLEDVQEVGCCGGGEGHEHGHHHHGAGGHGHGEGCCGGHHGNEEKSSGGCCGHH